MARYDMAYPDVIGWCDGIGYFAEDEGDDYPHNDDRYTFAPADFLAVHMHCMHSADSPIYKRMKEIEAWLSEFPY